MLLRLTLLALLTACGPCLAQSTADMEAVIRSSKLVDTHRQLKATLAGSEVNISTYCSAKAADKDCKITALLMLKELSQHYKNIRQVRVNFFDEYNTLQYRTIVVTEKQAQLVDNGTPIAQVLSSVAVAYGNVPTSSNFNMGNIKPGAYYLQRKELARSIQRIIDQGGRPDDCVAQLARLEQACTAQRPNTQYCTTLYNSIVVSLDNASANIPTRSKKKRQSATAAVTSSEIQSIKDQVLNNAGSGNIDGALGDIERLINRNR